MGLNWGSFTIGTFFGILLTQFIEHLLAKDRSKVERNIIRYNQAVEKFKDAFNDAIINLNCDDHSVALILQKTFESHKVGYIQFRGILSKKEKIKFDSIWKKYEEHYNNYSKGLVFSLFASAKTNYEIEHRNYVLNMIQELLSFAKEK